MQQFKMYDPRNPQPTQQLLRVYNNPMGGEDEYFLVKQDNHLLVCQEHFHTYPSTAGGGKAGTNKLFKYQTEIPFVGIRWLSNMIEQKFFKSPDEGDLKNFCSIILLSQRIPTKGISESVG